MRLSKYADLLQRGAVASCAYTYDSGWLIYEASDDHVIAGFTAAGVPGAPRRYTVYYSSGHCASPYFRIGGRRQYLDQFIRTDVGRGKK